MTEQTGMPAKGSSEARKIEIYPDSEAVARRGAELFREAALQSVAQHGRFRVALAGGSTPRRMYELLATPEFADIPWKAVHLFWGDERTVPGDHPDSNFLMVRRALLDHVAVPEENIHRVRTEAGEAAEVARLYEEELSSVPSSGPGSRPVFDLILLGMGADGHTASLFPGTGAVLEEGRRVTEVWVPKLNTWRISLTAPVIRQADRVALLVCGTDKADMLARIFREPQDLDQFPVQLVHQRSAPTWWLLDKAAAARLGAR